MSVANCNAPLPQNIICIINSRGLKQKAVAERSGYSKQQFSAMMNGKKIIRPCDTIAIANALGVTPNDLFLPEEQAGRR